jgi:hypothetical protein
MSSVSKLKQKKIILLNADGSCPNGLSADELTAAGYCLVHPCEPPREYGLVAYECEPQERDGAWYQTWELKTIDPCDCLEPQVDTDKEQVMADLFLELGIDTEQKQAAFKALLALK